MAMTKDDSKTPCAGDLLRIGSTNIEIARVTDSTAVAALHEYSFDQLELEDCGFGPWVWGLKINE